MSNFISYIWPSDPILQGIILTLILVAGFITFRFIMMSQSVKSNIKILDSLKNIRQLEDVFETNKTFAEAQHIFDEFANSRGKNKNNIYVFNHLNNIFSAGYNASRLNTDSLIENTLAQIVRGLDGVKSVISVFLIIGILGTLFGLAESIASFSGSSFSLEQSNIMQINQQISDLFIHLKGAFAPSMWGVFFTIVFVLTYSWYIQEYLVNSLTRQLTDITMKEWVPKLLLTDFQRGEKTIVKLKETINNAEGINKGVATLQTKLFEASDTIESINSMASSVAYAAGQFKQSVDDIKSLQPVYEKFYEYNKDFKDTATELLQRQTSSLEANYEKHFTTVVQSITKQLDSITQFTNSVDKSNNSISIINSELARQLEISNQSIEDLAMQNVLLNDNFRSFADKVHNLNTEAITKISEIVSDKMSSTVNATLAHMHNIGEDVDRHLQNLETACKDEIKDIDRCRIDIINKLEKPVSTLKAVSDNIESTAEAINSISASVKKITIEKENKIKDEVKLMREDINNLCKAVAASTGVKVKQSQWSILERVASAFIGIMLFIAVILQCALLSSLNDFGSQQIKIIDKIEQQSQIMQKLHDQKSNNNYQEKTNSNNSNNILKMP